MTAEGSELSIKEKNSPSSLSLYRVPDGVCLSSVAFVVTLVPS